MKQVKSQANQAGKTKTQNPSLNLDTEVSVDRFVLARPGFAQSGCPTDTVLIYVCGLLADLHGDLSALTVPIAQQIEMQEALVVAFELHKVGQFVHSNKSFTGIEGVSGLCYKAATVLEILTTILKPVYDLQEDILKVARQKQGRERWMFLELLAIAETIFRDLEEDEEATEVQKLSWKSLSELYRVYIDEMAKDVALEEAEIQAKVRPRDGGRVQ